MRTLFQDHSFLPIIWKQKETGNKAKITRRNDINEYMVLYDVICFIISSVWNDNLFLQDDKKYNRDDFWRTKK